MKRNGYGQVEPNQLSAQKTGQIYASLPLDKTVNVLQNGEFMFYDYATDSVTAGDDSTVGEPMLVFNEIKLYEPFWRTTYKDFAMIRVGDNYVTSKLATEKYGDSALTVGAEITPGHTEYPYRMDGIAPRLFKTNIGDIMTTNMVILKNASDEEISYAKKDILVLDRVTAADGGKTLVLVKESDAVKPVGTMKWQVAKVYTMPDGQDGLKIQRVQ